MLPHEGIQFGLCKRSNEANTHPILEFIEDVPAFLKENLLEEKIDAVLQELDRLRRGLKSHQQRLLNEKAQIQSRLPDLENNLKLVNELETAKEDVNLRFMAADSVWTDAVVEKSSDPSLPVIGLWLGANVLVEYTYAEAKQLLSKSILTSQQSLESKSKEMVFVKSQLTTCEVTISRFYNYDVQRRKQLRDSQVS